MNDQRQVAQGARMDQLDAQVAQWRAEMAVLIDELEKRARAGFNCTLTPQTALRAAMGLRVHARAPTRHELGKLFCGRRPYCPDLPCTNSCLPLTNQIENLYRIGVLQQLFHDG